MRTRVDDNHLAYSTFRFAFTLHHLALTRFLSYSLMWMYCYRRLTLVSERTFWMYTVYRWRQRNTFILNSTFNSSNSRHFFFFFAFFSCTFDTYIYFAALSNLYCVLWMYMYMCRGDLHLFCKRFMCVYVWLYEFFTLVCECVTTTTMQTVILRFRFR